ncbi:hypothetical protein V6C03_10810 [Methyloligella sp. 2.7D]|uniref:hypothetical protein n=1 Tax=unclassified Methyloligella TaxID=2625955 RepID=UPI00157CA850|nr:hypothetical protein [Methyloligella sp. GL2]QKP77684.1 hypothetical protein HT051_09650 [Methyloligella sp. GL2]
MKSFKRCILHIGTAKTGTTTLQASFAANRARLAEHGILYPQSPGETNHTKLAAYATDAGRMTPQKRFALLRFGGNVDAFRRDLEEKMAAEFEGASQDTLLFSNEHLQLHLASQAEKQRLRQLLDRWCEDYRVVVYLRRQDKAAVSLYSSRLKAGETDFDQVLPKIGRRLPAFYDYRKLLEEYGAVFGMDRLEPAIFEPDALKDGDIVADFYARLGIADLSGFKTVTPANESLNVEAQAFLASFNRFVPRFVAGIPVPGRASLINALGRDFTGPGRTVSRAEAEGFYARFADDNAWIRETFFNPRNTLFDEDFSAYPEHAAYELARGNTLKVGASLARRVLSNAIGRPTGS